MRKAPTSVGLRPRYIMVKIQMMFAGTSTAAEMKEFMKMLPLKVPVFSDKPKYTRLFVNLSIIHQTVRQPVNHTPDCSSTYQ